MVALIDRLLERGEELTLDRGLPRRLAGQSRRFEAVADAGETRRVTAERVGSGVSGELQAGFSPQLNCGQARIAAANLLGCRRASERSGWRFGKLLAPDRLEPGRESAAGDGSVKGLHTHQQRQLQMRRVLASRLARRCGLMVTPWRDHTPR